MSTASDDIGSQARPAQRAAESSPGEAIHPPPAPEVSHARARSHAPASSAVAVSRHPRVRIDVRVAEHADRDELGELAAGLQATQREIPSKYFYDEVGSKLFELICDQPEYYPYGVERSLLAQRAGEIIERTRPDVLVEIGSGASTKTRFLLGAMHRAGSLRRYVPVDISGVILERVACELVAEYPDLEVQGLVEDFVREPGGFPSGGRRLIAFLGGTIGNFRGERAAAFLEGVAAEMGPNDSLLLGTDLIKDAERLEAAYNDARGVTAEFNKNILRVVNARARADFDPRKFRHRAFYDAVLHRIEMRLVALEDQVVNLARLPLELRLSQGEEIRTEVSTKFDRELVEGLLRRAGLEMRAWLPDDQALFALSLSRLRGT